MSAHTTPPDLSELLAENFGPNATYVESLLQRFRSDPALVDEAWRAYFNELLAGQPAPPAGNGGATNTTAATTAATNTTTAPTRQQSPAAATNAGTAAQTAAPPAPSSVSPAPSSAPPAALPATPAASSATPAPSAPPAQTPAAAAAAPAATTPAPSAEAEQRSSQATQTAPAAAPPTPVAQPAPAAAPPEARPIRGAALKIVENMETSLTVPTATSNRQIPVKVLEENRALVNRELRERGAGKTSFTHFIAFAILRALEKFPRLNDGFVTVGGSPARVERPRVNLGVAIDIQKKDGSRTLLVPNVKDAAALSFPDFLRAYDDVIARAREGKLGVPDFQETTISLTNPGTIGTVASTPRLMAGQSVIVATGAIEYPAEYHAMTPEALSQLGVSKTMTISSTYDHRIVQGAESGAFLAHIHELLLGRHEFYDRIFRELGIAHPPLRWSQDRNPALLGGDRGAREMVVKEARVLELINAFRVRGHLIADIDPLHAMPLQYHPELDIETYGLTIWDLDREFITGGLGGKESASLREILDILQRAYCGKVGTEYRHIQSKEQKVWIRERIRQEFVNPEPLPAEVKKQLLAKLVEAEQFERFLHTKYLGQKRFSLEGCDTIIPLLDQLVERAGERGVEEIILGMAHRGRLNVLANVVGDLAERIFTAFEGSVHPGFPADEGDVKYHQGAEGGRTTRGGQQVRVRVAPNPSHLEFVDPVVEGMVRARQDAWQREGGAERAQVIDRALPVLLHGDAAFAGQGIVMETLNLADLKGYRTGGTIHIIINNQIGFTTSPEQGRSTIYSTDVARMTQLPIFHINGDDPEAAFRTLRIALDFRQEFNKDVVLDVVGFRRLGHNETDEPSYTQPLMYARVKAHRGVRTVYAERLVREGVLTDAEVEQMVKDQVAEYEAIQTRVKEIVRANPPKQELAPPAAEEDGSDVVETPASAESVAQVSRAVSVVPEGFHLNPKMVSQLARRAKMGAGQAPLDWGFAELLAFGTLALDGHAVRLSGQDSGRGTFSQRHAILYDTQTGRPWSPLSDLSQTPSGRPLVEVFDSSLSEQGVMGFEYGYSVVAQRALVLWEAQFGDFSNGAQVIIDQFIAPGIDKWQQHSRLVLLLPHGYEGQGPEHSSARLERYLQLCAENNMQVCYPTTPAQYFHLLRRQVRQEAARPLVVMTPKSLLRLPAATSAAGELTAGGFRPVIDDPEIKDPSAVERVVVCSGKVYYDLNAARLKTDDRRVALVRLEQFYPFPERALRDAFARYPAAKQLVWAQEEAKNMGGWTFVEPRLTSLMPACRRPYYVGRSASASPATGSYAVHEMEQRQLVDQALTTDAPVISDASTDRYAGQADG